MNTSKAYNFQKELEKGKLNIINKLGYEFKDDNLLLHAITHSSLKNDCLISVTYDNEKLEFIGDSVLDLIVSNFLLWEKDYSLDEGFLSANRARLVNEDSLYVLAQKIDLDKILLISKSAQKINIQNNPSVLADGFEALIGAIFLDSSYDLVEEIVMKNFKNDFLRKLKDQDKDYKSLLNELTGKKQIPSPLYELVESFGPDHSKTFVSKVKISEKIYAKGTGKTIKESQQEAARLAYDLLKGENNV